MKNYTTKGTIILLTSWFVIFFFYDNLPFIENFKHLLPDNRKYAPIIIIFAGLFAVLIFCGFMYCFTTFIQFIRKYFKNKN